MFSAYSNEANSNDQPPHPPYTLGWVWNRKNNVDFRVGQSNDPNNGSSNVYTIYIP